MRKNMKLGTEIFGKGKENIIALENHPGPAGRHFQFCSR
jgi:hypothetical protein